MSFSYLLSSILSFYFCKPWICSCVKPIAFMICESGNSKDRSFWAIASFSLFLPLASPSVTAFSISMRIFSISMRIFLSPCVSSLSPTYRWHRGRA